MNTWVFGYGSLVSPVSLGATIGRLPIRGDNFFAAECDGWERRWNYGYPMGDRPYSGTEVDSIDTIVALGVLAVDGACMNGVVARVSDDELARLDRRERNYSRVNIATSTRLLDDADVALDVVYLYVPTESPLRCYADARDRGRAGVEIRYWTLVNDAFDALLEGAGDRYRSTTPAPDVPVVDVSRVE